MMKTTITFTQTRLFFLFFVLFPATVFLYSGCDKDDDDPAPTCDDGIQNQGETGVDCGGPCTACPSTMCNGNGQNTFLPLVNANYWKYSDQDASNAHYSLTINGTQVFGSNTYHVVEYCVLSPTCSSTVLYYIRAATNGDLYEYFPSLSLEYMLLPANPAMNQTWQYPVQTGIGSRKVTSLTESISTYNCSYTGCLKIQEYNASAQPYKAYYYKKGIGLVYENAGIDLFRLVEITLH